MAESLSGLELDFTGLQWRALVILAAGLLTCICIAIYFYRTRKHYKP